MLNTPKVKSIYAEIQKKLFYMIPEKWDKVYLYAAIIEKINKLETGEMFFYYYPKGILKKNPVNVYEIPAKFNIEEDTYMQLVEELFNELKSLRKEYIQVGEKVWSNLTIKIENFKFSIEYDYEDLAHSTYDSYARHIIWRYKYLGIEPINKKDKTIINEYLFNTYHKKPTKDVYIEGIYAKPVKNIIEYGKSEEQEPKREFLTEETRRKMQEKLQERNSNTNQILDNTNQILNQKDRNI